MAAHPGEEQARLEALLAQLEELEALKSCYDEELTMAPTEEDNLRFARAVAAGSSAASAGDVPALSGMLRLPGVQLAGEPVHLAFVMPRPGVGSAPRLQVHTNAPRQAADVLQQVAETAAAECAADGAPCLLVAADQLAQAARDLADADSAEQHPAGNQQPAAAGLAGGGGGTSGDAPLQATQQQVGSSSSRQSPCVLSRRCLVFHHIKNLNKRKAIVQWGAELGLGGWSKPGFPGVVLVEGESGDVAEYVSRLRQLRWQSIAVRAEEDLPVGSQQEVDAARGAPRGVRELGEEEMGQLAAAARDAGMEELFRSALRLGPV